MNEQTNTATYVVERVRAGASKSAIKEQLMAVGWSEDAADAAYAEACLAVGVPQPSDDTTSRYAKRASTMEIVLSFFSFILLGMVATALGTLYLQIINKLYPDALDISYRYYSTSAVNDAIYYAIAALMVTYPLYYFVVRILFRRFREDSGKVESKLTKWLTYLVLLIASVTIVGDLIVILMTFFQGEITMRFFLKALTILVIAGAVFGFYYLERKKVQYKQAVPRKVFQQFGILLSLLVLVGIIAGFAVAGSPGTERARSLDDARSSNLEDLARCVSQYANQHERLPAALAELQKSTDYTWCAETQDPETGGSYEYRVVSPLVDVQGTGVLEGEFELCATFARSSQADQSYSRSSKWYTHNAGRSCDSESVAVRLPY